MTANRKKYIMVSLRQSLGLEDLHDSSGILSTPVLSESEQTVIVNSISTAELNIEKSSAELDTLKNDYDTLDKIYTELDNNSSSVISSESNRFMNIAIESVISKYNVSVSEINVSMEDENKGEAKTDKGIIRKMLSAIWERIKAIFRAIKNFIKKMFKGLLSILGFKQKETINTLDKAIEEAKKQHEEWNDNFKKKVAEHDKISKEIAESMQSALDDALNSAGLTGLLEDANKVQTFGKGSIDASIAVVTKVNDELAKRTQEAEKRNQAKQDVANSMSKTNDTLEKALKDAKANQKQIDKILNSVGNKETTKVFNEAFNARNITGMTRFDYILGDTGFKAMDAFLTGAEIMLSIMEDNFKQPMQNFETEIVKIVKERDNGWIALEGAPGKPRQMSLCFCFFNTLHAELHLHVLQNINDVIEKGVKPEELTEIRNKFASANYASKADKFLSEIEKREKGITDRCNKLEKIALSLPKEQSEFVSRSVLSITNNLQDFMVEACKMCKDVTFKSNFIAKCLLDAIRSKGKS